MLSDKGSAVIKSYGILNTNIPEGHPFFGIPFPGDFLIGADGRVRDKLFMPDYQSRASASEILLRDFGETNAGPAATIKTDALAAKITLSTAHSVPAQELGVAVEISIAPGWHIYGEPIPENYVATNLVFDNDFVSAQSIEFPKATPIEFKVLGETLAAYSGTIRANGRIVTRLGLKPGDYKLRGVLRFQECSDEVCNLPQKIAFELPIKIEAMTAAAK
jgi:DsbC/DsbD-like thiol-disulfide interchange protein